MGGTSDDPRPGFDRCWVSFPGQGLYYNQTFNIDGERVPRQGYTTDLITDYALDFLAGRRRGGGAVPALRFAQGGACVVPARGTPSRQLCRDSGIRRP